MSDDAKEWVTVKVPKADKEQADDYRPEDSTFGDCLVAGAERLNEHLDSDPGPRAHVEPELNIPPDVLAEALEASLEFPEEVKEQLDRIESAASTAEERTGQIQGTLDELGGR